MPPPCHPPGPLKDRPWSPGTRRGMYRVRTRTGSTWSWPNAPAPAPGFPPTTSQNPGVRISAVSAARPEEDRGGPIGAEEEPRRSPRKTREPPARRSAPPRRIPAGDPGPPLRRPANGHVKNLGRPEPTRVRATGVQAAGRIPRVGVRKPTSPGIRAQGRHRVAGRLPARNYLASPGKRVRPE